ncbi:hypothetical protein BVC93_05825 [Mycobacterium sp. MS1601]|nr:hypothetical protein BVC93_05825 [Mycobacterium sp. MS1601]
MSDRADTGSMPMTEPHEAPIFDTGPHPTPMPKTETHRNPWFDPGFAPAHAEPVDDIFAPTDVLLAEREESDAKPQPVQPVAVPGQYQFLKAWKLITVLFATWVVAGAAGVGLYYWWFQAPDKTWVEVAVLMYVLATVVGALLVSLPDQRPTLSAMSIALMTAPFASGVGAAVLYGSFVMGWVHL